jgi:hypothetical protein
MTELGGATVGRYNWSLTWPHNARSSVPVAGDVATLQEGERGAARKLAAMAGGWADDVGGPG